MVEGEMTNKEMLAFINQFWPLNKNPGFGVRKDVIIADTMIAQLILDRSSENPIGFSP